MNWPGIYAWDIVHDRINGLKLLDSNLLQLNPVGSSIFSRSRKRFARLCIKVEKMFCKGP